MKASQPLGGLRVVRRDVLRQDRLVRLRVTRQQRRHHRQRHLIAGPNGGGNLRRKLQREILEGERRLGRQPREQEYETEETSYHTRRTAAVEHHAAMIAKPQRSFGCGILSTGTAPIGVVFSTSFVKKNLPSIGTIMIWTLSERRSATIF